MKNFWWVEKEIEVLLAKDLTINFQWADIENLEYDKRQSVEQFSGE